MTLNPTLLPDANLQKCKCCSALVNPDLQLCPVCNFPLKGTEKEQTKFIYDRGFKQQELKELTVKTENAAITFYIIAGLSLLAGLMEFFRNADSDDSTLILAIYGAFTVIYIVLGSWSMKKPVAAITTGLVLYIMVLLLAALGNPAILFKALVFKAIVLGVLIRALINALNAEKIRKEHKI